MRSPLLSILLVTVAAACVLLPGVGSAPLWDEDEPKNAACSLAMLDSADWVVPTFNGDLRVEKPPLINWVQLAGVSLLGRNEAGIRIGSAVLTIGSCLLSWWLGRLLAGPLVGLLTGLIMASCIWTAIGGRAATPDAPLVFCTTLAAAIFVHAIHRGIPGQISWWHAVGIGVACGLAMLAKGPIGIVLPLAAFIILFWWQATAPDRGQLARLQAAVAGVRPLTVTCFACAIALPWYLLVTLRTGGRWLEEFVLVHNVGRFTAPMEGHDGSLLYYPAVITLGLFPWSLVILAVPLHAWFTWRSTPRTDARRLPLAFATCWATVWVGTFSLAGTKLPGYIWPAYPALALATASYLTDWLNGQTGWEQRLWRRLSPGSVMHLGWASLGIVGCGFLIGLPLIARRYAPGDEWLGLIGLVPMVAAGLAATSQQKQQPRLALATLAVSAVTLLALLGGLAAVRFSQHQGTAGLIAAIPPAARPGNWAGLHPVRPSLVFYTGRRVDSLPDVAACLEHLRSNPSARLVIPNNRLAELLPELPADCQLLSVRPASFDPGLAVIGRTDTPANDTLAQQPTTFRPDRLERF